MFASIYGIQGGISSSGTLPIIATGGTMTGAGSSAIVHTFTSSGTFAVSSVGTGGELVDYLVIAGGGAGGSYSMGGGGGAGGYRASWNSEASGGGGSSETGITATVTDYTVTVGAAGAGSTASGAKGVKSADIT